MPNIVHYLIYGSGGVAMMLFIIRASVGLFFVISGYHKLTNHDRHVALAHTLAADRIPLVAEMQWFVPIVELMGGLGVMIGLLAPVAATGLVVICTVACLTDAFKRIPSFKPIDRADEVDDALYLPEVLYILLLLPIVAAGAGSYSLDAWLWPYLWPQYFH